MPAPIPISTVNHISRVTADVQRSLAFYRDVLGFRQVWRPNFNFAGAWLFDDRVMIHLIEGTPPSRSEKISTRADHVAFDAEDVDAVEAGLKEHGIEYNRGVNAGGITQIFFHDPDGNHIEIGTYPPARKLDE